MRRPTRGGVLTAMAGLVLLGVACGKILGIEPASERASNDGGGSGSIIDATMPPEDGSLPPLGDKDAACGDTTSDIKNCGACGLDCQGAKCTSGRCEPAVFVYGLLRPSHLAVTDEGVYWVDTLPSGPGAGVRRCDLTGCPNNVPRTLYERADVSYDSILVDGDSVLALRTNYGGIDVCNRLGCSSNPIKIGVPATSIAVAAQKAHYTTPYSTAAPTGSAIARGVWRCEDLPYCFPKTHVSPNGSVVRAVDADLYVLDEGTPDGSNGVLFRCVGGSCASPMTLASGLSYAWSRFVASKHGVGWISMNGGEIKLFMCEAQSCGGGPKTLATLDGWIEAFAFDERYLYWTNSEYSAIERVAWASANAKPEVVLTKQGLPIGIAMRNRALYFTRQDFGDIVRWVPPP